MESHSRSDRFWLVLQHLKESRFGLVLFYGYLGGVLVAGAVAVVAIAGNHDLALKANGAATKAESAALVANRALCLQKAGNIAQLQGAKAFLVAHPDGTADFSRALILNAIHNDAVDVAALRDVHCGLASPPGTGAPAGPRGPTGIPASR